MTKRTIAKAARPGFSLLELTLVLAIIGILMAMAAVNFIGAGDRAKVKVTKTTLKTVKDQLTSYNLNNNAYPPDLTTLVTAKYLQDGKINDAWDTPLYYATPGMNGQPYDLMSFGADKLPNTEDDLNVWTIDFTKE